MGRRTGTLEKVLLHKFCLGIATLTAGDFAAPVREWKPGEDFHATLSAPLAALRQAEFDVDLPQEAAPAAPSAEAAPAKKAYDPTSINLGFGAILPKGQAFQPLTGQQRIQLWKRQMFLNPQTYARTLFWASRDLGRSDSGYASGALGFAQRFGSRYARGAMYTSIRHGLAAAAGYDLRYVRSSSRNVGKRIVHAVLWDFQTLDRNGKRVFNWPRVVAVYSSEMMSAAWTPRQKWSAYGVQSANEQMAFGWITDLAKEFLSDLKRKGRKKKH
jgi:hypothetical protein